MNKDKAIKYYKLAKNIADIFSKDPSTKVGAITIDEESLHIRSMGYNGFPRNLNETNNRWEKPEKYNYVVHAEANMICNACKNGTSLKDSILIVTMFPCNECDKLIIQAGIKTIISLEPDLNDPRWGKSHKISIEMFNELNIKLIFLSKNDIL